MTKKNPWLGLASYEEPKNDGNDYLFCGRDEETLDMVRLIDNNLFITLYGSSGIGKTSLLRAGVIPILRRKDYFPLYVRLSQEPKEISCAEAIVRKLQSSGLTEESTVAMKHPDGDDRLYLWNYFAITRFFYKGREVYPVIILDQFEEVFREGDKAKAELLLKQIYLLLNDELEMPDEACYSADTNYRFVASIREDFLFVLEDSIDENSLDLYKNNRYRLRPMKPEEARQVVLVPGKDCIEESEKEVIAERIISLAKRPQSEDIDTLLLSIVCSGTYDKKVSEKIISADLAVWKNNPMEVYYRDAVKGLSAPQIRYIQQHLIREDGSRRRVDAEEVKAALSETTYHQLTQGANRLFALGDKGQVELLHDQLGMAVYEERKAFEERERKKRLKRRIWLIGSVVFSVLIFFLIMLDIIGEQQIELKEKQWKLMNSQAKFIAEKANRLTEEGDSFLAQRLLLAVYPTIEVEAALRKATNNNSAILRGHTWSVNFVTFSSDGTRIISGSGDHTVKIWDALTGEELKSFYLETKEGHGSWVGEAALSPDDKYLAAATKDSIVRIWDMDSGQEVVELVGHTAGILSVEFNYDGTQIVTSSWDGTVRTWNAKTGNEIYKYDLGGKTVFSASFSPDGTQIVATPNGQTNIIINTMTGKKKTIGYYYETYATYSFDGQYVISCYSDRFYVWDAKSGNLLKSSEDIFSGTNMSFAMSPDGKLIATTSATETAIHLFDVEKGVELRTLEGHTDVVRSIAFSPDGKRIVSGSHDKTIRIWDINIKGIGKCLTNSNGHTIDVYSAKFSSDGSHIASISMDYNIPGGGSYTFLSLWNANDFRIVKAFEDLCDQFFNRKAISYSPDGKLIAFPTCDDSIRIYEVETGSVLNSFHVFAGYGVNSIDFSPDGKRIVTSSYDDIHIWDVATGNELLVIKLEDGKHTAFAFFSPDGKRIVSAYKEIIQIRDSETGKLLLTMEHDDDVCSAFFSPDGTKIVSASEDNTVRIWDAEWGSELQIFKDHIDDVNYASFSPDGSYVVSASADGTVRIWDVNTGEQLQIIHQGCDVYSACFSPDGKRIVSVNSCGEFIVFDFPTIQDLIEQTWERFKDRPLTDEERRMYYLE